MVDKTPVTLMIFLFAAGVAEAKRLPPPRSFTEHVASRRTGATPRDTVQLSPTTSRKAKVLCGLACFGKRWCRAFNIRHLTGQCELFDLASAGTLVSDSNCSYSEKASEMRDCERLPVVNGVDIPADTAHMAVVNVSCDGDYGSVYTSIICEDGVFTAYPATAQSGSLKEVICYEGGECPTTGCSLPFPYGGTEYDECIPYGNNGQCWCYTEPTHTYWKNCRRYICSPEECHFPFTYEGKEYNECITARNDGQCWCYTEPTFNGWKNCS